MSENINQEIYTELANRIYDLDGEVYRVLDRLWDVPLPEIVTQRSVR